LFRSDMSSLYHELNSVKPIMRKLTLYLGFCRHFVGLPSSALCLCANISTCSC